MATLFQRKPIREKRNFIVALYPEEHAALTYLAEKYGISMTEVVLTALHRTFSPEIPEELQADIPSEPAVPNMPSSLPPTHESAPPQQAVGSRPPRKR